MDVFHRAYSQLHDLYRSMTPGSRMTAGLLALAVIVGGGYLVTRQTAQPAVDLLHGVPVSNDQLLKMQAALGKAHLTESVVRGSSLYVPQGQEATYLAALATAGALPQNMNDILGAAAGSNSFLESIESGAQREQRSRLLKQQAVSMVIRSRPGIESADVLYDDTKASGFNEKVATAIAYVKPTGSNQLDETMVRDIRLDVAGAYAGLKPENVTVSDRNGRTWPGNAPGIDGGENSYRSLKRACERDLKAKILRTLSGIPNVAVELNVELDRKQAARAHPSHRAANPASSNSRSRRLNQPKPTTQSSDVVTLIDSLLSGGDDREDAPPEPAAEKQAADVADWTPTLAKVSIRVPLGYFKQLWRERNPAAAGQNETTPDQAALDRILCRGIGEHQAVRGPAAAARAGQGQSRRLHHRDHLPRTPLATAVSTTDGLELRERVELDSLELDLAALPHRRRQRAGLRVAVGAAVDGPPPIGRGLRAGDCRGRHAGCRCRARETGGRRSSALAATFGRRSAAPRGTFRPGRRESRDGCKYPPPLDRTGELTYGRCHDQSARRRDSQGGHSHGQPQPVGGQCALLGRLRPEQADLVRRAAAYLDEIDANERQRILDEFRRIGPLMPERFPSGIELDKMPAGPVESVRPVGQTFVSAARLRHRTGRNAYPTVRR